MVDAAEPAARDAKYRSSRFPYCPVLDLEAMHSGMYEFEPSYSAEFYTKSGTAHHENIQFWMPNLPRHGRFVWGDWGCTNHKCPDRNKVFHETGDMSYKDVGYVHFAPPLRDKDKTLKQKKRRLKKGLRPHVCPKCQGTKFKYLEIVFLREHGVSGHVDKVLLVGAKIYILDYKTTTFRRFEGEWEGHLPYLSNVAQISNYCVMFERKYKHRPTSWVLVYVPRERPKNMGYYGKGQGPIFLPLSQKWTDKTRRQYSERLDRAKAGREAVEKLLQYADSKKPSDEKITALAVGVSAIRPCRIPLEYETYLEGKFKYKEPCPHFKSGKCSIKSSAPTRIVNRIKYLANEVVNEEDSPSRQHWQRR